MFKILPCKGQIPYFQHRHGTPSLMSLLKDGGVSCLVNSSKVTHQDVYLTRASSPSAVHSNSCCPTKFTIKLNINKNKYNRNPQWYTTITMLIHLLCQPCLFMIVVVVGLGVRCEGREEEGRDEED